MIIDFQQQQALTCYHLLTQTVTPRPIAWVLSENELVAPDADRFNLAPFSFFNAVCSEPPLLMLSVGKKPDGGIKDTRRNLLSGREFVIHIASLEQAQAVNVSAAVLNYGESEVAAGQLELTDFPDCPLPRLKDCHVAYHCKLYDAHDIGPNQQSVIYAEVLQLYLSDDVAKKVDDRYIIDAEKLNPLARLGGAAYAELGKVFTLQRP
jgi:flavin reductase (DIM6/NTAB) family NADH-FMN oxidoreductase RutF